MSAVVSTLRLAVFLVAAVVAFADSGNAQNPPWCAILDNEAITPRSNAFRR
jgi:hypothetical protein